MAEHTRCPVTKAETAWPLAGEDAEAQEIYRTEVLARAQIGVQPPSTNIRACELPFHAYLEMLSLLAPRYYSISSSPQPAGPARCSVTVGVVAGAGEPGQGRFKGVCSNFLAGRRAGDTIHATVRETKAGFRLPDDPATPIVMIGPGTGLAPFRGFLQERARARGGGTDMLGPAMLFFGCRRSDQDFLYADELKDYAGARTGRTACRVFPRQGQPKTYVQTSSRAKGDSDLAPDRDRARSSMSAATAARWSRRSRRR